MRLEKFTLEDAKDMCTWKYDGYYSVYNEPSWEKMIKSGRQVCNEEIRDREYVKVLDDNNNYIGYGRIRDILGTYLVGFAMKPEYTGKGLGKEFVNTVIKDLHGKLILEVRIDNKRAIKCYESCGFKKIDIKKTEKDGEVLVMGLNKD